MNRIPTPLTLHSSIRRRRTHRIIRHGLIPLHRRLRPVPRTRITAYRPIGRHNRRLDLQTMILQHNPITRKTARVAHIRAITRTGQSRLECHRGDRRGCRSRGHGIIERDFHGAVYTEYTSPAAAARFQERGCGCDGGCGVWDEGAGEGAPCGVDREAAFRGGADAVVGDVAVGCFGAAGTALGLRVRGRCRGTSSIARFLAFGVWLVGIALCAALGICLAGVFDVQELLVGGLWAINIDSHCILIVA